MPVAPEDGALGIEARHQWISAEAHTVLATLGDETAWPRYWIMDVVGLDDFPAIDDISEPKTENVGSEAYPGRARERNVTYTVEIEGRTLQEMRQGVNALKQAFGPDIDTGVAPEQIMIITPHPDYGEQEHAFRGKCLQFSKGTDAQASDTRFARSVVIGIKCYEPRLWLWNPESEFGFESPRW